MPTITEQKSKLTALGGALGLTEVAQDLAITDKDIKFPAEGERERSAGLGNGLPVEPSPASLGLMLSPVMNLAVAKARLAEFQEFVKGYMKAGEDYGQIPGVEKPSLFQPGADKLAELYGLAPTFPDDRMIRAVDWGMTPALYDYEVTCVLINKRNGQVAAEGKGSCSSYEARYRWRDSKRLCPKCSQPTIIKGNEKYGGGWVCWAKRGGCGTKFDDGDKSVETQAIGRVPNEDIPDIKNTILKMAQKRAKIAAVLAATRSSGVFTQDVEDMPSANGDAHEVTRTDGFVVQGSIDKLTPLRGDVFMKIGEKTCVARKELGKKFEGLQGETVEVLVTAKISKDKAEFYEIKELQRIITLEDVPF